MKNMLENHKIMLSLSLLFLLACSVLITILSQNHVFDSISITSSILFAMGFIVIFAMIFLDFLTSVCNP